MSMFVIDDCIWKEFLISLYRLIIVISTDQSFDIKECARGILRCLVLSSISYQSRPILQESNITRCNSMSLFIGTDVDSIVPPDSNTGISGSQVNTDARPLDFAIPIGTTPYVQCSTRQSRRRGSCEGNKGSSTTKQGGFHHHL
mmetsp:Transcript_111772/g.323045  ORF Transcript_111772/g.323045 Transcript_111772/m.323045 type:complete len:144 (-) Transcript_111772:81-512(-)